jgi:hypothetical protein
MCFPVLDSDAARENKLAAVCERSEDVLGFIQRWVFCEWLSYYRRVKKVLFLLQPQLFFVPMKTEQTECSETLACKIQTPGNYPEESTQYYFLLDKRSQLHCI